MRQVNSLNHTRWECKYHIVFIPKYRKKVIFGQIRRELGDLFHSLAKHVNATPKARLFAATIFAAKRAFSPPLPFYLQSLPA